MGRFDQVLLTVDYDRTLTAPDSTIPERNLEAIRQFMADGGAFTVNTGRSVATFWQQIETIPVNAPFLLYNGSAAYADGKLTQCHTIDLDVWQTMETMANLFPDLNLEIQGASVHYLINQREEMVSLYHALGWRHTEAQWGQDVGPFLKFSLFGRARDNTVAQFFSGSAEEIQRMNEAEQQIRSLFGDKVEVFRAAPRIIDVHAKGVSKIRAARELQNAMGRRILVCVGDAENDISMLDGADYAFCPADGVVADRYETVCNCAEGAVADVIYKKIPEILAIQP